MRLKLPGALTELLPTAALAENVLEEVTATATKRAENLQGNPFAVTALGQEPLDELNIANLDDYIRFLPGVNSAGRGDSIPASQPNPPLG